MEDSFILSFLFARFSLSLSVSQTAKVTVFSKSQSIRENFGEIVFNPRSQFPL